MNDPGHFVPPWTYNPQVGSLAVLDWQVLHSGCQVSLLAPKLGIKSPCIIELNRGAAVQQVEHKLWTVVLWCSLLAIVAVPEWHYNPGAAAAVVTVTVTVTLFLTAPLPLVYARMAVG